MDRRDINLLEGLLPAKKQFDVAKSMRRAGIIVIILVVVLAGAYAGLRFLNGYVAGKTADLRAEAASYTALSEAKAAAADTTAELETINNLLDAASGTSRADTELLWSICSTLNQNIFLTNLSVDEAGTLSFSGKAMSRADISSFVYSLKKTALFSDVSFVLINTEVDTETDAFSAYQFNVTAILAGGAGNES